MALAIDEAQPCARSVREGIDARGDWQTAPGQSLRTSSKFDAARLKQHSRWRCEECVRSGQRGKMGQGDLPNEKETAQGACNTHQQVLVHLKRSDRLKRQDSAMHLHAASKTENSVGSRAAPACDCILRPKKLPQRRLDAQWVLLELIFRAMARGRQDGRNWETKGNHVGGSSPYRCEPQLGINRRQPAKSSEMISFFALAIYISTQR